MTINKFEFEYCGYGFSHNLHYENNSLIYTSWSIAHPDEKISISPSDTEWKRFFQVIRPITKRWKRKYERLVCDGITWAVNIHADDFKIRTRGLHLFPENFACFLDELRVLMPSREFLPEFCPDDFISCTLVPHPLNRRIKRLMRAKKLSLQHLSEHLKIDKKELRHLLNSEGTFEVEVLANIAGILGLSTMDLLYEADLNITSGKPKLSAR